MKWQTVASLLVHSSVISGGSYSAENSLFPKGHCFIEMTWAEEEKGIKALVPQHLTNSKITESTVKITNYT